MLVPHSVKLQRLGQRNVVAGVGAGILRRRGAHEELDMRHSDNCPLGGVQTKDSLSAHVAEISLDIQALQVNGTGSPRVS